MKLNGYRRVLYGVWATVEVLLFGGLVYGWPSLVFLLKQRGVYSDLCYYDVIKPLSHNLSSATNTSLPTITASPGLPDLAGQTLVKDTEMGLTSKPSSDTKNVKMDVTPTSSSHTNSVTLSISTNKTREITYSFTVLDTNSVSLYLNGSGENSSKADHELLQELNCEDQDVAFALAYTIVAAMIAVGSVAVGHAQRLRGMRATRVGTGLMYIAGLLMIGFVTPERPALLITGMGCVAVAGLALLITNVQLGGIYGRGQSTFVGLLSGCFDVSAIVQLLIKMVVSSGVGYLYTYIGMAVLNCLTLVSALLWLPKGPVLEVAKQRSEGEKESEREALPIEQRPAEDTSYVTSRKLMASMTSPLYILHVVWFSVLQLRLLFFVGVLNRWLTALTHNDLEQVDHYTSVQLYTGCGSVVFAILAGSLYDLQRHRYQGSLSRERRHLGGAVLPLFVGTTSCCAVSLLVLVPEQHVLYVTFLLLAAFRSLMYSLAAAFVSVTFPAELFGVLYGTIVVCGGVVGCLQYPLFIWSETSDNSLFHVNIFLLGVTVLTYAHPLFILWKCRSSKPPPTPPQSTPPPAPEKTPGEKDRMIERR